MTTTHHHEQTAPATEVGEGRRKRLSTLLVRRSRLAARWAEEQSHLLRGADDLAHELAVVEQAISHCYPSVDDRKFSEWVARDAALLHSLETPSAACRLCSALAHGPDAA